MPPPTKPTFTTYQQHYSPAKSSLAKPPVPSNKQTNITPATSEDVSLVDFETAKQQLELLQLSILHQASDKSMRDFTATAKRRLGRKHTKLRKDYEGIRASELVHQRAVNLAALQSWCSDPSSDPSLLIENLQILGLVYSDLEGLLDRGGRYAELVSSFERWIEESIQPVSGRFVQSLPEDWHAAQSSLALKLRSIQRNLGVLPPCSTSPVVQDEASGLGIVLKSCPSLVDGMLKELDIMTKIEREVLEREQARVEDEVRTLSLDNQGGVEEPWVPVWTKALATS